MTRTRLTTALSNFTVPWKTAISLGLADERAAKRETDLILTGCFVDLLSGEPSSCAGSENTVFRFRFVVFGFVSPLYSVGN